MNVIKKLTFYGERLLMVIGVLSLATIVVIITLGIISRYVFGSPFAWTEELASFLFIILCFSGASVAAYRKKHVVADYIINRANDKIKFGAQIVSYLLIIAFLGVVFYASIKLQPNLQIHRSINLGIPRNFYYLPLLIASFYMLVVYSIEFIELLSGKQLVETSSNQNDADEESGTV